MSISAKVFLWFTISVTVLILCYVFKSFTPPILAKNSIASLKSINVNNDRQFLLIRGRDRSSPVMLFVHGGPGMPAMFLAHDFQRDLEKKFVIVHWDQRGSGKSYDSKVSPEELSISNILSDMDVIVDYLRTSLDKRKIWIVGHSHGSYLGALYAAQHPDKIVAFVGVGQVADLDREKAIQDEFLRSKLVSLGLASDTEINDANRETLLFLSGSELYGETSFAPLLVSGLKATEYSLFDILNVGKGSSFSSSHMNYDMMKNLIDNWNEFEVPFAIIMGRYDMTTPLPLAQEYYSKIRAPAKKLIILEKSAHFPHFEQPDKFTEVMLDLETQWE